MKGEVVVANGWRYVRPYVIPLETTGGWVQRRAGATLVDALVAEFTAYTRSYFDTSIQRGLLLVNGAVAQPGYALRPSDTVAFLSHRHELPISAAAVEITPSASDPDLLIINKPASWPVHPGGAYRKATLTWVLENEHGIRARLLYRLDRLVSGLLIVGRTASAVSRAREEFLSESTIKIYVARVRGRLGPRSGASTVSEAVHHVNHRIRGNGVRHGAFESGPHVPATEGKSAQTEILPVAYEPLMDTSVVLLRPITGRTHQLRCHLQSTGHPIANDPCYGGRPNILQHPHGKVPSRWEVEHSIIAEEQEGSGAAAAPAAPTSAPPLGEAAAPSAVAPFSDADAATARELCPYCSKCRSLASLAADASTAAGRAIGRGGEGPVDGAAALTESAAQQSADWGRAAVSDCHRSGIWLHCLSYTVGGTQYRVAAPGWLEEACFEPGCDGHHLAVTSGPRAELQLLEPLLPSHWQQQPEAAPWQPDSARTDVLGGAHGSPPRFLPATAPATMKLRDLLETALAHWLSGIEAGLVAGSRPATAMPGAAAAAQC